MDITQAEEYVESQGDVRAAFIRGNELWLRTFGGELPSFADEVHVLGANENLEVEYAWLDDQTAGIPNDQEARRRLRCIQHQLEEFPLDQRQQKLLEVLRQSATTE